MMTEIRELMAIKKKNKCSHEQATITNGAE